MSPQPSSAESFEAMYRSTIDPWHFADDPYERSRYETIVASLPPRRFGLAFEPGCSVGELTALLAPRCDRYVAIDISPTAANRARRRCAHLAQVEVRTGSLTDCIPADVLDLVVLSEIGYYFGDDALSSTVAELHDRLASDAVVVACHWLGSSPDHALSGGRVHQILARQFGPPSGSWREDGFRLDVWRQGS